MDVSCPAFDNGRILEERIREKGKRKNTYQVAFAAVGQPSPIQMAWSSAG